MSSYGLTGLSLITRSGVRVLIDQAAGIVIALLGALSLIALLTAATMLTASARAEIQRRLHAIGIWRAIGASRGHVARVAALEALLVAVPAAALGVGLGALLAAGPSDRLLGAAEPGRPRRRRWRCRCSAASSLDRRDPGAGRRLARLARRRRRRR